MATFQTFLGLHEAPCIEKQFITSLECFGTFVLRADLKYMYGRCSKKTISEDDKIIQSKMSSTKMCESHLQL